MTLPTGNPTSDAPAAFGRRGFTLIELILVMALLVVVLGVTYPSLKGFFRGRELNSEARRLLSLTRYGQSRAVSEGVPMELWINPLLKTYGLRAEAGYLPNDGRAVQYDLQADLEIQVSAPPETKVNGEVSDGTVNLGTGTEGQQVQKIRFYSDGFIGEKSPAQIQISQSASDSVILAQSASRLHYEIQSAQPRR